MNKITRSRQWGLRLAGPAPLLVILLTACKLPLPITPEVVAAAEDTLAPAIIITSPADNTVFSSTTRITGKVSDHALKNGDNLGSLSSLSVVAGANSAQKGKILIDTAGKVRAVGATDPSGGDAKITYNANTGDFSIEMDTKNLNRDINVRITALDLNGNSGVSLLNLLKGDGPLITFDEGSSDTQLPKSALIRTITIKGTIADNEQSPGSIKEIKSVVFEVDPVGVNHTITLSKEKPTAEGAYITYVEGLSNPDTKAALKEPKAVFILNADGTFSCVFETREQYIDKVNNSAKLEIAVRATDKNERSVRKEYIIKAIEKAPNLSITKPVGARVGKNYYSSQSGFVYSNGTTTPLSDASIPFEGFVTPNGGKGGPEVIEVKVREQKGKLPDINLSLGTADSNGKKIISGPITLPRRPPGTSPGPLTFSGPLSFRIIAKDNTDSIATLRREFIDDTTPPTAFSDLKLFKVVGGVETPLKYAKAGDRMRVKFSAVSDTGSGVDLNSLKISGTNSGGGFTPKTPLVNNSNYTQNIDLRTTTGSSPYGSAENIDFTMSVKDNVGNTATKTAKFKYYHTAPANPGVTVLKTSNLRPPSAPTFLRLNDTIKFSFPASRDINTDPGATELYLSISGTRQTTLRFNKNAAANTYESDYTVNSTHGEGPVSWSLKYVDMAGNTQNYPTTSTTSTIFTVDKIPPTISSPTIRSYNAARSVTSTTSAGIGSTITVGFTLSEAQGSGKPTVSLQIPVTTSTTPNTINIRAANVNPTTGSTGRTQWEATYAIPATANSYSGRPTVIVTAQDRAGNTSTAFSHPFSTFNVDTIPPSISTTPTPTISSNNSSSTSTQARRGDTITVDFTLSEPQGSGNPTVSLEAPVPTSTALSPLTPVSLRQQSGSTDRTRWRAVYSVSTTGTVQYSGAPTLKVTAQDRAGNSSGTLSHPFSTFNVDTIPPSISTTPTPTISSNNSSSTSTQARRGDTITVDFTLSEPQGSGNPTVSLEAPVPTSTALSPLTPVSLRQQSGSTDRTRWRAVYSVSTTGTVQYSGAPTLKVTAQDRAGNSSGSTLSHNFATFNVDTVSPSISSPTIRSYNAARSVTSTTSAGIGSTITVGFTLSEAQGSVKPTVSLQIPVTTSTTPNTINIRAANVNPTTGSTGRTQWEATYAIPATANSYSGRPTVIVTAQDRAGNTSTAFSHPFSTFNVDTIPPSISTTPTPTISSNNSSSTSTQARRGDTITVDFTLSEPQGSGNPTVSLEAPVPTSTALSPLTPVSLRQQSGSTDRTRWRAVYSVSTTGTVQYSGAPTLKVTAQDATGNSSGTLSHTFSTFNVDTIPPSISTTPTPTISSNNSSSTSTQARRGDTITVDFTLSEPQGSGNPTVSLEAPVPTSTALSPLTLVSLGQQSGSTDRTRWRAVYSVSTTGTVQYSGAPTLKVTAQDRAGNSSGSTLSHNFATFNVDTVSPSVISQSIRSNNSVSTSTKAGIGNIITVGFTLSEAQGSGKPTVSLEVPTSGGTTSTINISSRDVNPTTGSTTQWRATYTVSAPGGSVPTYSGGAVTLNVTATDAAGNTGSLSHLFVIGTGNFTIDNERPTFNAPTINTTATSVSGGISEYASSLTNISIRVTNVSTDVPAGNVNFAFTRLGFTPIDYPATQGTGTASTWWSNTAVPLPPATSTYRVRVKVVDDHGNESTDNSLQIRVIP